MTILHAFILGIIEGLTEFLPVSSTAHLIIGSYALGLSQSAFVKTFEIAIQSGAILAVLIVYWKKFLNMGILKKVIVAFIPTGIIGLLLYKVAKQFLLGNLTLVLWTLAIGGVFVIFFELYYKNKEQEALHTIESMSYVTAMLIGVFQALAIIPGVSRSAATIVAGRLLGLKKSAIVEFSFLLAVPTILAATGLDLIKNLDAFTSNQVGILTVGFITSLVFALISISFLLSYIRKRTFIGFGIYRIVIVLIVISFIL